MFVPAWALRVAPYVGGLLLAVAAYAWAYSNGREAERAKWQKREAAAVEAAQVKERALQAQVDAAGAALSEAQSRISNNAGKAQTITRTYYVANPSSNVACLDDGRVQHITQSDAAAIGNPAAAK
jgi:Flp pilus assembly protein TadB